MAFYILGLHVALFGDLLRSLSLVVILRTQLTYKSMACIGDGLLLPGVTVCMVFRLWVDQ